MIKLFLLLGWLLCHPFLYGDPSPILTGELTDTRGTHLFSFSVNGATATIKAISTGYMVNVGGAGAQVQVAHGRDLGLIESSAYPMHADSYTNEADSVIMIKGASYTGTRGLLKAYRDSVWVDAPSMNLNYMGAPERKLHRGKPYDFYAQQGHGIIANKGVLLFGSDINVARSMLISNGEVRLDQGSNALGRFTTHGTYIKAGSDIMLSGSDWHGETQTVFAGTDGSAFEQNEADLVCNSIPASMEVLMILSTCRQSRKLSRKARY